MKINCIIVDDEPIARKGITEYISDIDFLELKGQGENALVANALLSNEDIDLVFLDIQMPKMTGIEFLKTLKNPPMVVFTTAYSDYALQSYELDVLDYLVKPISFERFLKACNKAKELFVLKKQGTNALKTEEYFFIRCKERFEKIIYNELLYVEAMENYVIFHTTKEKFISYLTFKAVESYLPANKFLKVHKSYIVAISKIESLSGDDIIIKDASLPIGRTLKEEVINKLVASKLLKR
ncbi:MAG TPA: LytTR family DNA-binding domain-containing protein [Bacteroidia bacterium]|nr:LytTR family DNA-binding domain-containing protein [Bacteroidia bacterium]